MYSISVTNWNKHYESTKFSTNLFCKIKFKGDKSISKNTENSDFKNI